MAQATRAVEQDLCSRHAPWSEQLLRCPVPRRCTRLFVPLARRARLRLLADAGLAGANEMPLDTLLNLSAHTFTHMYNPVRLFWLRHVEARWGYECRQQDATD